MLTARKQIAARPVFTIVLRPEPHCLEPIKALRAVLKNALRSHGLKCVGIAERPSAMVGTSSAAIATKVASWW
jgi:hypothetical protein